MTAFTIYKFTHLLGIVLLLGNITVTSVWKVFADRTRDAAIIAFSQRMVTGTDFGLTVPGILLTIIGGYGAMRESGYDFPGPAWLVWSQFCFVGAGLVWIIVLIPIQIRQARLTRQFASMSDIPHVYRGMSRRWLAWGLIATVPLVAALYLMIDKPG
jgi:uncharacterized membrane protein